MMPVGFPGPLGVTIMGGPLTPRSMTRPMPFRLRLLSAGLLATLFPACILVDKDTVQSSGPSVADRSSGSSDRSAGEELDKARRDMEFAELELAIAERKSDAARRKSEQAVEKAERAVEVAEAAMDRFVEHTRKRTMIEAELSVASAENRLVSARQDLEGILAIYEEEPEASAKDEIIRRHEVGVAMAEASVELASMRLAEEELRMDAEHREHEGKVADARTGLELAEAARETEELSLELDISRKEAALETLERKIERLEEKSKKTEETAE